MEFFTIANHWKKGFQSVQVVNTAHDSKRKHADSPWTKSSTILYSLPVTNWTKANALLFVIKRQRGTVENSTKQNPNQKTAEQSKGWTFKTVRVQTIRVQTGRKTSFANRNRRSKYTRTGKPLKTYRSTPELAQAIDSQSICGRLLRITRINTDRFKQLSSALKNALNRYLN